MNFNHPFPPHLQEMYKNTAATPQMHAAIRALERTLPAHRTGKKQSLLIFRPLLVLLVGAALVLASGIGIVNAAQQSIPGDSLYTVKRVTEQLGTSLTLHHTKKIEKHQTHATTRIVELEKLIVNPKATPAPAFIQEVLTDYQDHIAAAYEEVQILTKDTEAAEDGIRKEIDLHTATMEQLSTQAPKQTRNLIFRTIEMTTKVSMELHDDEPETPPHHLTPAPEPTATPTPTLTLTPSPTPAPEPTPLLDIQLQLPLGL